MSNAKPTILSVEDNRDTQQLIQRLLERAGYEVLIAEHGLRAMDMLVTEELRPDLILLDILMQEIDGYDFCAKLGITPTRMAQYIADFLTFPYQASVDPKDVQLGILPAPFCRKNNVAAVKSGEDKTSFVLSNPFNLELMDHLNTFVGQDEI